MNNFKQIVNKTFNNYSHKADFLVRTSGYRSLKFDVQSYIVYNTKLNCPVFLQEEAWKLFLSYEYITEEIFERLDKDGKEVIMCLIE